MLGGVLTLQEKEEKLAELERLIDEAKKEIETAKSSECVSGS